MTSQTNNSISLLQKHNVVLSKYGQDLYVDQTTIKSNYPTEEGKNEECLRLIGNLEWLMDRENPDQHEIILTLDGAKELRDYLELWVNKQSGEQDG